MMMMMTSLLSVLTACLLVMVTSALDPHQLELKQHYEHLAYIADFPCHHPQPRVIPVHKLFSESQSHGKAYFPDVTVLYRCDECTGSCTAEHKCAPKLSELVLLPFKATYLEPTEKHKVGSWAMEYHELLNHTECGCIPRPPPDSCPPESSEHMHKRDKPLTSSGGGRPDVSYNNNRPQEGDYSGSSGSGSNSDNFRPGGSSGSSGSGSNSDNFRPGGSSGSSGSGSNSGDENYVQQNSEVNRETTTPDYLSQLFERNGN